MDRNSIGPASFRASTTSLSARRAWIEIVVEYKRAKEKAVALRKESVDRNSFYAQNRHLTKVALRKESVDRNYKGIYETGIEAGRSPQGERG